LFYSLATGIGLTGQQTNTISREGLDKQTDTVCLLLYLYSCLANHWFTALALIIAGIVCKSCVGAFSS
jgi:hypothetical protein